MAVRAGPSLPDACAVITRSSQEGRRTILDNSKCVGRCSNSATAGLGSDLVVIHKRLWLVFNLQSFKLQSSASYTIPFSSKRECNPCFDDREYTTLVVYTGRRDHIGCKSIPEERGQWHARYALNSERLGSYAHNVRTASAAPCYYCLPLHAIPPSTQVRLDRICLLYYVTS
ncbi:hypothetical protein OH77DRAFT_856301 [Trametes cingulata]|nr:hypothetical protein OH77DRAFT_856301 [Trametes cingulata]